MCFTWRACGSPMDVQTQNLLILAHKRTQMETIHHHVMWVVVDQVTP